MALPYEAAGLAISGPPPVPSAQPALPEQIGFSASGTGVNTGVAPWQPQPHAQDTSGRAATMVTHNVVAMVESDKSTLKYEHVPLFALHPPNGVPQRHQQRHRVMSLQYLNSTLMKQAIDDAGMEVAQGGRKRGAGELGYNSTNGAWALPMTVEGLARGIAFLGYQVSASAQDPDRHPLHYTSASRVMGVQNQGEINNYPNIWSNEIKAGDMLAFAIKRVPVPFGNQTRQWDGSVLGVGNLNSALDMLQVVPVHSTGGNIPYGTTLVSSVDGVKSVHAEVVDQDADTQENVNITFNLAPGQSKTVPVKQTIPAHIIPVGRVIRTTGSPSTSEVMDGRRTYSGYEQLKVLSSLVDIDLVSPRYKRATWLCI
jgi:hypothetical protein